MSEGDEIGDVFIVIDADGDKFVAELSGPTARRMAAAAAAAGRQASDALESQFETVNVPVIAHLVTAKARAELMMLVRERVIPIVLELNKRSVAKLTAALSLLSGFNFVKQKFDFFGMLLSNLDKFITIAGLGGIALGSLSSLIATIGLNIVSLIGSLATIVPLVLGLPAVLLGAGAAGIVLVAAMQDMQEHLGELAGDFEAVRQVISDNFWEVAAEPIREMVRTLLPQLSDALGVLATSMGGIFQTLADELATMGPGLNAFLGQVSDAVLAATPGILGFFQGFMNLALGAGKYLEPLADDFTRLGELFSAWTERIVADGSLDRWLERGYKAAGDLWTILREGFEIFAGIARAAEAAGSTTLASLADLLTRISDTVNTPAFQGALVEVFTAINEATANLGPGISALMDAFVALGPTIGVILPQLTSMASVLMEGLAAALSDPIFARGLTDFFAGMERGINAVAPVLPNLGKAFGLLLSAAGVLADAVGDVLFVAFDRFEPLIPAMTKAAEALIPVLSQGLISALETLAPIIVGVVEAFSDWIDQNPNLSATVGVIAAVLGTLAAGAVKVITALFPLGTALAGLIGSGSGVSGMMGGLSGIVSKLGGVFQMLLGPLGLIIAGFIVAYSQSEPFRNAINDLLGSLFELAGTIISSLMPVVSILIDALGTISAAVMPLVIQVFEALIPIINMVVTSVVPLVTQLISFLVPAITGLINLILPVLIPALTFLAEIFLGAVLGAINGVADVLSGLINVIQGIITFITGVFTGNWSQAWEGIKQVFFGVIEAIWGALQVWWNVTIMGLFRQGLTLLRGLWSQGWNFVKTFVTNIMNGVSSFISTVWTTIRTTITTVMNAIRSVITSIWNAIRSLITTVLNGIRSVVSSVWNTIRSTITSVMNGIRSTISSIWNAIRSLISSVLNGIRSTVTSVWNGIRSTTSSIWNGIKNLITTVWNSIKALITAALNMIKTAITGAWNLVKSLTTSAWNTVKSTITNAWNGIKTAVSNAINGVIGFVRAIPSRILGALGNLSGLLKNAGKQVIDGFLSGLKGAAGAVTNFLGGLTDKLPSWKGPPAKDRKILANSGKLVMQGFTESLQKGSRDVETTLRKITNDIALTEFPTVGIGPVSGTASGSSSIVPVSGGDNYQVTVQVDLASIQSIKTLEDFLMMLDARTRAVQGV